MNFNIFFGAFACGFSIATAIAHLVSHGRLGMTDEVSACLGLLAGFGAIHRLMNLK